MQAQQREKFKQTLNQALVLLDFTQLSEADLLPRLKDYLALVKHYLSSAFVNVSNPRNLVLDHALLVDKLLKRLWQFWLKDSQADLSLIAVGGYGRGELHPHSDIDLLILSEKTPSDAENQQLEKLIALLWDCHLKVGHAVRNFAECISLAEQDLSITTNIMESRLLCGNKDLFNRLLEATAPDKMWPATDFFSAKMAERKARYKRFDGSSFDLEPNVKSSPGGLRDIHLIGWIAQRAYYPNSLNQLVSQKVITKKEYYTLVKSQLFIWRVRFALHLVSNKAEDRLLFDYQKSAAELMGFSDSKTTLAVEKMMKRYYRAVLIIRNLSDILLQVLEQKIFPQSDAQIVQALDEHFHIINQRVAAIDLKCFSKSPRLLLEIFHHVAKDPRLLGIEASTLRAMRAARHKIRGAFRHAPENKGLFVDFWRIRHTSSRAMFLMKRSGVLADYLKPFSQITGQMQYDMFHNYTVDEHTLFLLKNLSEFADPEHNLEFPLCSEIMQRQNQPEIIFLAGLFHDIGKGRGGDHSELGSMEAKDFCSQHPVDEEAAQVIEWLVANHLLMSLVAQKRDITNPKVIQNFADLVQTQQRLELLYLLTVADIRATSNTLWNSWKDSLLKALYLSTSNLLCNQPSSFEEGWQQTRNEAKQILINKGVDEVQIENLWQHLDNQYFSKRPAKSIAWQTQKILTLADPENGQSVVEIRALSRQGGNEVFVYTRDQENLFAALTATLNQQGLSIQAANIYTDKNSYCYDNFFVLDSRGKTITDPQLLARIKQNLLKNIENINQITLKVQRRVPRQYKYFSIPTQVSFFDDEYSGLTRMELSAMDRPGLLAAVGNAFKITQTRLHDARIMTLGEKVEDIFVISHANNQPVTNQVDQNKIADEIIKQLGSA